MTYSTKHTHAVNYFFPNEMPKLFPSRERQLLTQSTQDAVGFKTINKKLILAGN